MTGIDGLRSEAGRIQDEIEDCDECEEGYICESHTAKLATLGGAVDLGDGDEDSED